MLYIFYKIGLLLKYQNEKFKRFCTIKRSLLLDMDQIFYLQELLVNAFCKVKLGMNKIIIVYNCSDN